MREYEEYLNSVAEELKRHGVDASVDYIVKQNCSFWGVIVPISDVVKARYDLRNDFDHCTSVPVVVNRLLQNVNIDWKQLGTSIGTIMASNAWHYSVMEYDRNREFLSDIPHKRFLDLAVAIRVDLGERCSTLITQKAMESAGYNVDTLFELAWQKMKSRQIAFAPLSDILGLPGGIIDLNYVGDPVGAATNAAGIPVGEYGAGVIARPDFPEFLASKFDSDCYVLPSSVHECLVVPIFIEDVDVVRGIVRNVNIDEVSDIDKLSDTVYLFDRNKKEIRVAD